MNKNKANPSELGRFMKRVWFHIVDFPYVWIVIILLAVSAYIAYTHPNNWDTAETVGGIALLLMSILLLTKPMNAIYGLIGTSGSIRLFFGTFILITLIFAFIYQFGFFQNAGITYDVNQPHIDFHMFAGSSRTDSIKVFEKRDTVFIEHSKDSVSIQESIIHVTNDTLCYQKIDFSKIWKSTIMTTLTQDAADLFTIAIVHNASMDSGDSVLDEQKSYLFEWILIFHIIISWIFFGVFISLLYNKFRFES